jgi:hypothetical protein
MRFIRKSTLTERVIEWDEVKTGARATRVDGKIPLGPGEPMLTMEAREFADMAERGVTETKSVGVIYQIKL